MDEFLRSTTVGETLPPVDLLDPCRLEDWRIYAAKVGYITKEIPEHFTELVHEATDSIRDQSDALDRIWDRFNRACVFDGIAKGEALLAREEKRLQRVAKVRRQTRNIQIAAMTAATTLGSAAGTSAALVINGLVR